MFDSPNLRVLSSLLERELVFFAIFHHLSFVISQGIIFIINCEKRPNMFTKTKVVIGQLGSPKSTKTQDVREYLREFLGDPRVVDINPLVWKIILNLFVLPFRPKKSAKAYSRIWNGKSFPLIENTFDFTAEVEKHLDPHIEVNTAFLLSKPRPIDVFTDWVSEDKDTRADRVIVLPQFPQYSESTVGSVYDSLGSDLKHLVNIPSITVVAHYHKLKAFIDHSASMIQKYLDEHAPDELIISFHGIPLRRVLKKEDEYYFHCFETFELIKQKLSFPKEKIHMTFQSRFGSEQWLGPATDEYAVELVARGGQKIACYCPSFVVDCLETTDEIGHELREELFEVGGELVFIPCLNADQSWAKDYAEFINTLALKDKKSLDELFYHPDPKEMREKLPEQKPKTEPMSEQGKKNIKAVFFTLFMDLVGFSLIFPLFPAIAKYYLAGGRDSLGILAWFFQTSQSFLPADRVEIGSMVLFGGVFGAIYSFLQFFASPFWGRLSDRMGRRPVLLTTLSFMAISYALWIFSESFEIFLGARILGGLMSGNMAVATAVVADSTTRNNRSKGMAYIGIAFALGFVLGPALGGAFSLVDLSQYFSISGLNPFSAVAAFAFLLSLLNLLFVWKKLAESKPPKLEEKNQRVTNPLKLFSKIPYPGVSKVNLAYFFFILLFSGMEFTLTFLAFDRLGYSPADNAWMFVFIGFVLAFVQGGYVRRKASTVGELKLAKKGLILIERSQYVTAQFFKRTKLTCNVQPISTSNNPLSLSPFSMTRAKTPTRCVLLVLPVLTR